MLEGILNLLTGGLLRQLTDNLIVIGLALFAISLGFFAIHYLKQRRQMLHQERMATLIKGLHYAGVAPQVLSKPRRDTRDHVLSGVRWLFGAAGVSGAMYGYEALQPTPDSVEAARTALIGIVPGALGLAHLFFAWLCGRRNQASNTAGVTRRVFTQSSAPPLSYRPAYRPAIGRRG